MDGGGGRGPRAPEQQIEREEAAIGVHAEAALLARLGGVVYEEEVAEAQALRQALRQAARARPPHRERLTDLLEHGMAEELLESELADLQAADAEASAASSAKDASSPAHSSGTAVILKTGAITALLLTFQQLSGVGAVLFYGK